MSGGLALGEGVVRRRVADQEDGDGRQPDVRHQVLVVARLRPDLERSSSLQHLLSIHCTHIENHKDTDELCEAEGHPELEGGEGGDERGSALLDHLRHAPDVDVARRERRRHGGLRSRQRYSCAISVKYFCKHK